MEIAYKLQLLFLVFQTPYSVLGKTRLVNQPCCIESRECKKLQLKCNRGGLIYKPEIEADAGECLNPSCNAKTPNLKVEEFKCYWSSSCTISFPRQQFVTGCFDNFPTCLKIKGWRCIDTRKKGNKKTELRDICSEKKTTGGFLKQGIIRSHTGYPSHYDQITNKTCSQTLAPKEDGSQVVIVTIDDIDIDTESDNFTIIVTKLRQKQRRIDPNKRKQRNYMFQPGETIKFHFSTSQNSKRGRGFIICFKFVDKRTKKWNRNVCQQIMKRGRKPKGLDCMTNRNKIIKRKSWKSICGDKKCGTS